MTDPAWESRGRLDKWLWAARFFKTRGLAKEAVEAGRVRMAGERVKPSRALRVGDELSIQAGEVTWVVRVAGLSDRRGPACEARLLYEESQESQDRRQRQREEWVSRQDPGATIKGRPTKRDRRLIHRFREGGAQ